MLDIFLAAFNCSSFISYICQEDEGTTREKHYSICSRSKANLFLVACLLTGCTGSSKKAMYIVVSRRSVTLATCRSILSVAGYIKTGVIKKTDANLSVPGPSSYTSSCMNLRSEECPKRHGRLTRCSQSSILTENRRYLLAIYT